MYIYIYIYISIYITNFTSESLEILVSPSQEVIHIFIYGFGLSPTHLVYWIRSDGDMCSKVNTCYYLNGSNTTGHWT